MPIIFYEREVSKDNPIPSSMVNLIVHKVANMLKTIIKQEHIETPVFVCVLKGALPFFARLTLHPALQDVNLRWEFVYVTSYENQDSTGEIKEKLMPSKETIENKDVFIIEDIVDTGLTVSYLKDKFLNEYNAKKVYIVTMLDKPSRRKVDIEPDIIGVRLKGEPFVYGFGLDMFDNDWRHLQYITAVQ